MSAMDVFQLYNNLSLVILAGSLLAVLGLRTMTGSPSQQIELIQERRTSLEETSRNCMCARSAALAREYEAHEYSGFSRTEKVIPLASKRLPALASRTWCC